MTKKIRTTDTWNRLTKEYEVKLKDKYGDAILEDLTPMIESYTGAILTILVENDISIGRSILGFNKLRDQREEEEE